MSGKLQAPRGDGHHKEEGVLQSLPDTASGCAVLHLVILELSPPFGIYQVSLRKLIDFDEFGVSFEKCNRTRGWAVKVMRIQKDRHYHHGTKMTVIFAIKPGHPDLPPHVQGSIECP